MELASTSHGPERSRPEISPLYLPHVEAELASAPRPMVAGSFADLSIDIV
jgi:hypothetical protein